MFFIKNEFDISGKCRCVVVWYRLKKSKTFWHEVKKTKLFSLGNFPFLKWMKKWQNIHIKFHSFNLHVFYSGNQFWWKFSPFAAVCCLECMWHVYSIPMGCWQHAMRRCLCENLSVPQGCFRSSSFLTIRHIYKQINVTVDVVD